MVGPKRILIYDPASGHVDEELLTGILEFVPAKAHLYRVFATTHEHDRELRRGGAPRPDRRRRRGQPDEPLIGRAMASDVPGERSARDPEFDAAKRPAAGGAAGEAVDAASVPDDALAGVVRALGDIHDTIRRCAGCENYLTVVVKVRRALDGVAGPRAATAREQLDAWIAEAEGRVRATSHCEVCVPAGPYERFVAALEGRP